MVKPYGERIQYHSVDHCGFPGRVRNYGIERSHAEILAFLDADDECLPGRFERQLRLLEETGADLVFCDAEVDCGNDQLSPTLLERIGMLSLLRQASGPGWIEDGFSLLIKTGGFINGGLIMVRRSALARAGCFDPSLRIGEDYDLATRIAAEGRIALDFTPGVRRREHSDNISADWSKRWPDSTALYERFLRDHRVRQTAELLNSMSKRTAQAYRGMGSWYLSEGNIADARRCWRRSMQLRTLNISTAFWLMSFLPAGCLRGLQRIARSASSATR